MKNNASASVGLAATRNPERAGFHSAISECFAEKKIDEFFQTFGGVIVHQQGVDHAVADFLRTALADHMAHLRHQLLKIPSVRPGRERVDVDGVLAVLGDNERKHS